VSYETVIGVEVHVELRTHSKMFCGCSARFGDPPNTNVCPVCLGLPGALPVPNRRAIDGILAIGLALRCRVNERSIFHRKNYFYADMPKNYQISQYDVPVCVGGYLDVQTEEGETRRIRINRVHMEEDTGKSLHVGAGGRIHAAEYSLIDFNRAGVPLVEIVTEPDLRSAAEARVYASELRDLILALGVSDVRLEEGSMRFDANVSVRPADRDDLGTKVEVKNMNSFRSLERAIAYEVQRQIEILGSGDEVVQETRHWDEEGGVTHGMRSKEESSDYRYFPEPDLVPLEVDDAWLKEVAEGLPTLPAERRERLVELGIDRSQAATLARGDRLLVDWLIEAVEEGADATSVANWLTGELTAYLRREERSPADTELSGRRLAELARLVDAATLSATAAKEVLVAVAEGEGDPTEVAEARDLVQISDSSALEIAVEQVLAEHPEELERLRDGDEKLVGFFVGRVMAATGGKADPKAVGRILRERTGPG
jgi:aspartyl-tRNA(Asn)/glutamyl-tRNA(Gln) amidotransferase subunit B